MQQEAEKVGIKINLLTKSRAELGDAVKKGKYHMTPSAITSDPNDDDPFNKWHTDGPANYINYSNPAFDKLVEENRVELVASERNKRYKKMQEIMAADQPVVFLYSPKERIVASNKINAETSSKRPGYFANTFTSKALVASDN
jgi:peptide/nickel transport system substrate-binding protein